MSVHVCRACGAAFEPETIRISDAAYAIGATRKMLQNWLQRGQVPLFSGHVDGWREFSFTDVATLAIVRRLTDYGVPVARAGEIAHETIARALQGRGDVPLQTLVELFERVLLVLRKEGETCEASTHSEKYWQQDRESFAVVRMGSILRNTFERLGVIDRGEAEEDQTRARLRLRKFSQCVPFDEALLQKWADEDAQRQPE